MRDLHHTEQLPRTEQFIHRARMMLTAGLSEEQVIEMLQRAEHCPQQEAFHAVKAAEILLRAESGT